MSAPDPPLQDDLRQVLIGRSGTDLSAALAGLKGLPARAAVHQVRVAARRLRALLRALRNELHPVRYACLAFELENLCHELAPLREATVRRQQLRSLYRPLPREPSQTDAWLQLDLQLKGTENELRIRLRTTLVSADWSERLQRIELALKESGLLAVRTETGAGVAMRSLRRALDRVAKRLAHGHTTPRALHRLRIATKRARYTCDAIARTQESTAGLDFIDVLTLLRKLQNALGELNDLFQLREWLPEAAIEPALKRALSRSLERRLAVRLARLQKTRKAVHKRLVAAAKAARHATVS